MTDEHRDVATDAERLAEDLDRLASDSACWCDQLEALNLSHCIKCTLEQSAALLRSREPEGQMCEVYRDGRFVARIPVGHHPRDQHGYRVELLGAPSDSPGVFASREDEAYAAGEMCGAHEQDAKWVEAAARVRARHAHGSHKAVADEIVDEAIGGAAAERLLASDSPAGEDGEAQGVADWWKRESGRLDASANASRASDSPEREGPDDAEALLDGALSALAIALSETEMTHMVDADELLDEIMGDIRDALRYDRAAPEPEPASESYPVREPGEAACGEYDPTGEYDCDRVPGHEGPHRSLWRDGKVWSSEPASEGEAARAIATDGSGGGCDHQNAESHTNPCPDCGATLYWPGAAPSPETGEGWLTWEGWDALLDKLTDAQRAVDRFVRRREAAARPTPEEAAAQERWETLNRPVDPALGSFEDADPFGSPDPAALPQADGDPGGARRIGPPPKPMSNTRRRPTRPPAPPTRPPRPPDSEVDTQTTRQGEQR